MDKERVINFLSDIKNRKMIIVSAAVMLLLIFVIFLIVLIPQNSEKSNQQTTTVTTTDIPKKDAGSGNRVTAAQEGSSLPKWNTYKAGTFSVDYSKEWAVQNGQIAGGGEIVIIKPGMLTPEINYPYFIIQTQPAAPGIIEQKAEIMKALGMKETAINIFGQKARRLSGTIPYNAAGGRAAQETIQETNILFTFKNLVYTLQYAYDNKELNMDLEEYFNGIIDGIKLK